MILPFLNRQAEVDRLTRLFRRRDGSLAVLYGRRRCGKSRLLHETLPRGAVYFVADEREAGLQRAALSVEMGFGRAIYPDWSALFEAWWQRSPRGSVLVLDEFQALVAGSPDLPSTLQRLLDQYRSRGCHLVLCGSSQRMMQGLVLDRSAPLFGRAVEILDVRPLAAGWIRKGLGLRDAVRAVESFATWGGVPRYWELAADFESREEALRDLVLDPLGVLHREPDALLLDDMRDTAQAASILQLIGTGCGRLSEIAGRLEKPATSLTRPMQRLVELGLVSRQYPFGVHPRESKRTIYSIADPFLRFWFRFVSVNRSRLEARVLDAVAEQVEHHFSGHVAGVWEDLVRESIAHSTLFQLQWNPAAPWWGPGLDRRPLEVDVVADSVDGQHLLVGSVKWEEATDVRRALQEVEARARLLPFVQGRTVLCGVWTKKKPRGKLGAMAWEPEDVLSVLV